MTPNEILNASPLDLLFQNRNKQYGAYILRKQYNSRLWVSLGIALSMMPLVFLLFSGGESTNDHKVSGETVVVREFTAKKIREPLIRPEKTSVAHQTTTATRKYIDRIKIVDNNKLIPRFTPQDDVNNTTPGTSDQPGVPNAGLHVESHSIVGKEAPVVTEHFPPLVQSEPEFPGGARAWLAFLQKNLRVPGELGEGDKKTVLIRFQVSTEGMVTGFEILQSGGTIYDNEVIRVLKKMPRWKPAIQNNMPVARSFTQPVTFMGVSE
jgi:protein TonB